MEDWTQKKNIVAASAVGTEGAARHVGWSPLPDLMQENNGVATSVVVAAGAIGHAGSPSSPPPAMDVPVFPTLSYLGDPMAEIPPFEEVISDKYSGILH